ncbi:MAG: hypothetical protein E7671_03005 [Ruminococcaceae bacterium]|nr:hypothetical protein [Oscillospiraceae bacterium]
MSKEGCNASLFSRWPYVTVRICLCADSYFRTLDSESAKALFFAWNDPLCRALDCLPLNENGILYNDTTPPHSPYGFTDTIAKTGLLCFETLLVWRAIKALIYWSEKCGIPCEKYIAISKSIERCFEDIFLGDNGMLIAATNDCRQTDIWASCFALSIGFPLTKTTAGGIRKWLADNYDSVVCEGQIRHLPAGEYWERTFVPVEKETYQNGAFWATATGWFADAIAPHDMGLAQKTLNDVIEYFEKNGIFECINGEYRKLDTYVASACAVYGACKRFRLV